MSITLRLILIILSVLSLVFIIRKIRFSKMQIEYAIFWIILSVLFIILAIFPSIAYWITVKLGIMSTANLIFLMIIGILLVKVFMMTIEISVLENRIRDLVQQLGIDEKNHRDDYNKFNKQHNNVNDSDTDEKLTEI